MKREKIFKKACKGSGIQIINNTYIDENDEIHTRNQWVNLGGAAYVIDFPRTLTENEILYLAGVQSEVEFFLREYGGESPCVIARNGFINIAVFLPFKFHKDGDSVLADNALAAYKIISQGEGK